MEARRQVCLHANVADVDRPVYNPSMPLAPLSVPAATPDQPARERILWTAYALFYRHGVRATGVDRVIGESGVTKVTLYRHFPSKNDLVEAFLAERHARWMEWFDAALHRHGDGLHALAPALAEWLGDEDFRGCAFLNSTAELGDTVPAVAALTRQHKQDMAARIARLLPPSPARDMHAQMLALAVDGAIVHAQFGSTPQAALQALGHAVALVERAV